MRLRLEIVRVERARPAAPVVRAAAEEAQSRPVQRIVRLPCCLALVEFLRFRPELEPARLEQADRSPAGCEPPRQGHACRPGADHADVENPVAEPVVGARLRVEDHARARRSRSSSRSTQPSWRSSPGVFSCSAAAEDAAAGSDEESREERRDETSFWQGACRFASDAMIRASDLEQIIDRPHFAPQNYQALRDVQPRPRHQGCGFQSLLQCETRKRRGLGTKLLLRSCETCGCSVMLHCNSGGHLRPVERATEWIEKL